MGKKLLMIVLVIMLVVAFCIWQNNDVVVSPYEYASKKIPPGLEGMTIVHISDLHNKEFGSRLISAVQKQQPDLIVITGDLIDRNRMDIDTAVSFIDQAVSLAPVYYVTGNHEEQSEHRWELLKRFKESGAVVLNNERAVFTYGDSAVNLIGLTDPEHYHYQGQHHVQGKTKYPTSRIKDAIKGNLSDDLPNIMLAHRPEMFKLYAECGVDLVFTGHAHGGQIRIPFIGGLVAPNQGFFPKYTEGMHSLNDTTMVISRGLGNSSFPLRIFDRPEIVVVTLKS